MHAGERPKETAEVVALQNYLTECKEKRIVKLKNEIKTAAERVVFLLYHATLDGNHYDRSKAIVHCCWQALYSTFEVKCERGVLFFFYFTQKSTIETKKQLQ